MHRCLFTTLLLISPITITLVLSSSDDVKVTVYKGPKKCTNKNLSKDSKPMKIEENFSAGFHFTVTIDESSTGVNDVIGKKIESSHDFGFAPSFPVGQGKVIVGLDRGLLGLCRGASAYIVVPPSLGYGRSGKPQQGVYGDTTLRYDVEILDIQWPIPNDFIKIDANKDWKISRDEAATYFGKLGQKIDLDALWDEEDKDDDGFISWHEFSGPKGGEEPPKEPTPEEIEQMKLQSQQIQLEQKRQQIEDLIQRIDTDKDGKINKDELAATFTALGQEMPEGFWEESDPDGDGYITFEEFGGSAYTGGGGNKEGKGDEL